MTSSGAAKTMAAASPGVQAARGDGNPVSVPVVQPPPPQPANTAQPAAYPAQTSTFASQRTYNPVPVPVVQPPLAAGYQAGYPPQPANTAQPAAYPAQNGMYASQRTYNPAYNAPHAAVSMAGTAAPYQPAGTKMGQEQVNDGQCHCGAGWILFGVGWICWVTWIVGALLPICDRTQFRVRCRRSAWIGNLVMAILSTIFLIIIISLAATGKFKGTYDYYCTGYYCYY